MPPCSWRSPAAVGSSWRADPAPAARGSTICWSQDVTGPEGPLGARHDLAGACPRAYSANGIRELIELRQFRAALAVIPAVTAGLALLSGCASAPPQPPIAVATWRAVEGRWDCITYGSSGNLPVVGSVIR